MRDDLTRALGQLTLALWGMFFLLTVVAPLVIWWWNNS